MLHTTFNDIEYGSESEVSFRSGSRRGSLDEPVTHHSSVGQEFDSPLAPIVEAGEPTQPKTEERKSTPLSPLRESREHAFEAASPKHTQLASPKHDHDTHRRIDHKPPTLALNLRESMKRIQTIPAAKKEKIVHNMMIIGAGAILGSWTRYQLRLAATTVGEFTSSNFMSNTFFLPNMLGCIMMGMLTRYMQFITNFGDVIKDQIPHILLVGLGVGYCGSLTTFSSWMVNVGILFDQDNIAGGLNMFLTNFGAYCAAFQCGTHMCRALEIADPRQKNWARKYHDAMLTVCACVCIIPVIVIMSTGVWKPKYSDLLVLGCAPVGANIRYFLSRWFNPKPRALLCAKTCADSFKEWYPVGTWLANMLGTLIASSVNAWGSDTYVHSFNIFFSGSLSTVSTLIKEFHNEHTHVRVDKHGYQSTHQLWEKYAYGMATFIPAIFISFSINGAKMLWD
jgi:CrcB protein